MYRAVHLFKRHTDVKAFLGYKWKISQGFAPATIAYHRIANTNFKKISSGRALESFIMTQMGCACGLQFEGELITEKLAATHKGLWAGGALIML